MILITMSYPFLFVTGMSPEQNRHFFWIFMLEAIFIFGDYLVLWPYVLSLTLIVLHYMARRRVTVTSTDDTESEPKELPGSIRWINLLPVLGFLLILDYGLLPKGILLLALPLVDILLVALGGFLLLFGAREISTISTRIIQNVFGIMCLYIAWQIGLFSERELQSPPTLFQLFKWSLPLHIGTLIWAILLYFRWKNLKHKLPE